jgi:hypothetical protein
MKDDVQAPQALFARLESIPEPNTDKGEALSLTSRVRSNAVVLPK